MSESDLNVFPLPIEGMGQFIFRRRRLGLDIKISVERARMSEGVALDPYTATFVNAIAELKHLLVEAPEGCDIQPGELDDLDTFDDEMHGRVLKVWSALVDKEQTFRKRTRAPLQGDGEGAGGDNRSLVPPEVRADAE